MARRRKPSPLRTSFIISRPAIDAVGGVPNLLRVFGKRLEAYWRDQRVETETRYPWSSYLWVQTSEGGDIAVIVEEPRDLQPPVNVRAWIETSDVHASIHPDQIDPDYEQADALVHSHGRLTAEIGTWPEVRSRMCEVPPYVRRLVARSIR